MAYYASLFPASVIVQQIVAVPVHWSLVHKLSADEVFLPPKQFFFYYRQFPSLLSTIQLFCSSSIMLIAFSFYHFNHHHKHQLHH